MRPVFYHYISILQRERTNRRLCCYEEQAKAITEIDKIQDLQEASWTQES